MAVKFVFYGPPDSGKVFFLDDARRRFPESICLDLGQTAEEQLPDIIKLLGQGQFLHPVFISAGSVPLSEFAKFDFQVVRLQHETWEAYVKHLKNPHRYNLQAVDQNLTEYDTIRAIPADSFKKTIASDPLFGPEREQYLAENWKQILPL